MSTTRKLPITYQPWVDDAACTRFNPELWDGDYYGRTQLAKRICNQLCPTATRNACLQEALDGNELWTVRGGLSADERAKLMSAS